MMYELYTYAGYARVTYMSVATGVYICTCFVYMLCDVL